MLQVKATSKKLLNELNLFWAKNIFDPSFLKCEDLNSICKSDNFQLITLEIYVFIKFWLVSFGDEIIFSNS